jgi:hypothetical protein
MVQVEEQLLDHLAQAELRERRALLVRRDRVISCSIRWLVRSDAGTLDRTGMPPHRQRQPAFLGSLTDEVEFSDNHLLFRDVAPFMWIR